MKHRSHMHLRSSAVRPCHPQEAFQGRFPADGRAELRMKNRNDRQFQTAIPPSAKLRIDLGNGVFYTKESSHKNKTLTVCSAEAILCVNGDNGTVISGTVLSSTTPIDGLSRHSQSREQHNVETHRDDEQTEAAGPQRLWSESRENLASQRRTDHQRQGV